MEALFNWSDGFGTDTQSIAFSLALTVVQPG